MVTLVCCLPNGANSFSAPLPLGWAWEVPRFMAKVVLLVDPNQQLHRERSHQRWILDEEVPKPRRACWITVNVVGTYWSFALSSP